MPKNPILPAVLRGLVAAGTILAAGLACGVEGQLELVTVDGQGGPPIPCRVHLKNAAGRPVRPKGVPTWGDHFVSPGRVVVQVPLGNYTFEIEHGPEYPVCSGHFEMVQYGNDSKTVAMIRKANLADSGWYAGDLEVYRPVRDMELLMTAECLHVAQDITWSNNKSQWSGKALPAQPTLQFAGQRYCQILAGQHTRPGGTWLLLNLASPLLLSQAESEYPSPLEAIQAARKQPGAWIDVTRPYAWDLPMLVAAGAVDSIQLAYDGMCRDHLDRTETNGLPREKFKYPDPWGNAQWAHDVYYRLLDCGLRIPPSAGSGSGVSSNPPGYNRLYVQAGSQLSCDRWWEGLRAGRVVVTNGPLLTPLVEGHLPGHVFTFPAGTSVELEIGLALSMREPISYLEVVQNGRVAQSIPFREYQSGGRPPKVRCDSSGWFVIRAVTDLPKTYRFAMSGPYYVEMGDRPRISRSAAQFFVDWVFRRAREIRIDDPAQREAVIQHHRQARDFWQDLLSRADAE